MKKCMIGIGWVLLMAVPAMAQLMGLPIAGGAGQRDAGSLQASGGAVMGDDFNLFGARGEFALMPNLSIFGDAGVIDFDFPGADMGFTLQGGALFTLPLQLPVDVGVRGSVGWATIGADRGDDLTIFSINGGVVVSKAIEKFTPYAFLGFTHEKLEQGRADDDNTDLALAGGVEFALNEQFSLYGEVEHVDDLFFGIGGRVRF